jgi:NAD(P)-dependent dehydrogenase (short-subunit alcohol dehydrogenase family)
MLTVIVIGSGRLIGSESVRCFVEQGFDVVCLEREFTGLRRRL